MRSLSRCNSASSAATAWRKREASASGFAMSLSGTRSSVAAGKTTTASPSASPRALATPSKNSVPDSTSSSSRSSAWRISA